MRLPARLRRQAGRYSLVDGIPFTMPIDSSGTPALMAAFGIDARRAADLLPGDEVHPLRIWGDRGLLLITVLHYGRTDIGSYIEFSIGIACTHGARPAPPLLPALLRRHYGMGQFVYDLPVSTEISVKGGKGIWGMPKHQAYLEFEVADRTVTSRYWLDGRVAVAIELDRPRFTGLPVASSGTNYCQFRGLLMRSRVHFRARAGLNPPFTRSARLTIGDHPRLAPLKELDVSERPVLSAWLPDTGGVLDDYFEGWFLSYPEPPAAAPEGLESVVDLGLGREWPAAPDAERQPVTER
jgi:Acetoacetate decarboxylase (ADC)